MDLGLANLITLKRHLLAPSVQAQTTWDTPIADIGKGVAKFFDRYTTRQLGRGTAVVDVFSADRQHYVLSAFPIESITTVEQRDTVQGGWVVKSANDVIQNRDDLAGVLYFGAVLGVETSLLRITYAGGYWYDTTENESGSLPAGATAVPDDLRHAWLIQCQQVWDNRDKLGTKLTVSGGQDSRRLELAGLEWVPQAREILDQYHRFQLT